MNLANDDIQGNDSHQLWSQGGPERDQTLHLDRDDEIVDLLGDDTDDDGRVSPALVNIVRLGSNYTRPKSQQNRGPRKSRKQQQQHLQQRGPYNESSRENSTAFSGPIPPTPGFESAAPAQPPQCHSAGVPGPTLTTPSPQPMNIHRPMTAGAAPSDRRVSPGSLSPVYSSLAVSTGDLKSNPGPHSITTFNRAAALANAQTHGSASAGEIQTTTNAFSSSFLPPIHGAPGGGGVSIPSSASSTNLQSQRSSMSARSHGMSFDLTRASPRAQRPLRDDIITGNLSMSQQAMLDAFKSQRNSAGYNPPTSRLQHSSSRQSSYFGPEEGALIHAQSPQSVRRNPAGSVKGSQIELQSQVAVPTKLPHVNSAARLQALQSTYASVVANQGNLHSAPTGDTVATPRDYHDPTAYRPSYKPRASLNLHSRPSPLGQSSFNHTRPSLQDASPHSGTTADQQQHRANIYSAVTASTQAEFSASAPEQNSSAAPSPNATTPAVSSQLRAVLSGAPNPLLPPSQLQLPSLALITPRPPSEAREAGSGFRRSATYSQLRKSSNLQPQALPQGLEPPSRPTGRNLTFRPLPAPPASTEILVAPSKDDSAVKAQNLLMELMVAECDPRGGEGESSSTDPSGKTNASYPVGRKPDAEKDSFVSIPSLQSPDATRSGHRVGVLGLSSDRVEAYAAPQSQSTKPRPQPKSGGLFSCCFKPAAL